MPEYEIVQIDCSPQGLLAVNEFLKSILRFSRHFSFDFFDWEYNRNPVGPVVGFNALCENRVVAHFAALPSEAIFFGKNARGLLSVNTATHPDHRGPQMLIMKLAARTLESARELGYEFMYGVANALSTPLFERLGFQIICQLDVRAGIGTPRRNETSSDKSFEIDWNDDSLKWRLSCPTRCYRLIDDRHGISALGDTPFHGFKAYMGHFDSSASSISAKRDENMQSKNLLRPILYVGVDPDIAWGRSFHMTVPKVVRPSPLNLIFLDLTNKNRKLDRRNVLVQAVDFDDF